MKKFLPGLIIIILSLTCLEAKTGRISFGIKGGLNLASISVSPSPPEVARFENLNRLTGGIFFDVELGPLAIQPEFLFVGRGTKYQAFIDEAFYRVEWRHDYLEALLLLKWSFLQAGPYRLFVLAGPSFGYLGKAVSVVYDAEGKELASLDIKDNFRKSELALVFGAGLEWKVRRLAFSLEARYHLGLSNIALSGLGVDDIKNREISIFGGIYF